MLMVYARQVELGLQVGYAVLAGTWAAGSAVHAHWRSCMRTDIKSAADSIPASRRKAAQAAGPCLDKGSCKEAASAVYLATAACLAATRACKMSQHHALVQMQAVLSNKYLVSSHLSRKAELGKSRGPDKHHLGALKP